jgi:hypothetical protein
MQILTRYVDRPERERIRMGSDDAARLRAAELERRRVERVKRAKKRRAKRARERVEQGR